MRLKMRLLCVLSAPLALLAWAPPAAQAKAASSSYGVADFAKVRKFDAHVHVNVEDPAFLDQARADNFELLSINVDYPAFPSLAVQASAAHHFTKRDPKHFHYATTFSMKGFGDAHSTPSSSRAPWRSRCGRTSAWSSAMRPAN